MADEIQIQVRGLRELRGKLALLPDKMRRKVITQSLRKGANVMLRPARENAPYKTGALRKGIRIVPSRIWAKPPKIGIYLAIRRRKGIKGGRRHKGDPFYGKFQEDGFTVGVKKEKKTYEWINPRSKKKIKKVHIRTRYERVGAGRFVEGKHFMRNAYESTKETALQAIVDDAHQRIENVISELGL
jgi:HK97 gp10 family phage protein